jgi:hypothetical protein
MRDGRWELEEDISIKSRNWESRKQKWDSAAVAGTRDHSKG